MRKALYFLGILNDADIEWLVATGSRREVSAGVNLIEEGKAIESVYLVIDGAFSVRTAATGNREVARLMSGEIIGEMSFVDSSLPSATVQALERSFVLNIPRQRLNARLTADAAFAAAFYRALAMFLADRLRTTMVRLGGSRAPASHGEVGQETLDDTTMAGRRFDWIQKRLRTA